MSTIWEAQLREELRQDDPGPPVHRWWGPLIGVWEDAMTAGREPLVRAADLVRALAEEIGDTGLASLANRVRTAPNAVIHTRLLIEMTDELMKRSNAAKRMGRERGDI